MQFHILLLGGQDGSTIGGAQGRRNQPEMRLMVFAESCNVFQMGHLPIGGREVFVSVAQGGSCAIVPSGAAPLNAIFKALPRLAPLHLWWLPQTLEFFAKGFEGCEFPVINTATCVDVAVHIEAVAVGPIPACAVLQFLVESEVGDGEYHYAKAVERIMMEQVIVVLQRLGNLRRRKSVLAKSLGAKTIVGMRTAQDEHLYLAAVAA